MLFTQNIGARQPITGRSGAPVTSSCHSLCQGTSIFVVYLLGKTVDVFETKLRPIIKENMS